MSKWDKVKACNQEAIQDFEAFDILDLFVGAYRFKATPGHRRLNHQTVGLMQESWKMIDDD